jgi:hypothetical protein
MAVNPKSSIKPSIADSFFSKAPTKPQKLTAVDEAIMENALSTIISNSTYNSTYGTLSNSYVSNSLPSEALAKYEQRIAELSSANLDLSKEVLDLKKKIIDGNALLVDAEARLKLLTDTLMEVESTPMFEGILIPVNQWNAVLGALAASMHKSVALDAVIKKAVAKTINIISEEVKPVSKAKKKNALSLDDIYKENTNNNTDYLYFNCKSFPEDYENDIPF